MALDREGYFFTLRYTRGKICKVLGVTIDTLRHYEKCGIIKPQENVNNGYKYYSIADIEILNVVLFLRAMDVPIKDIPKFIECNDIEKYADFLEEQIEKANRKIKYWKHVRDILSYLKNTLENYEKVPRDVSIAYNTKFRFKVFNFDYANSDIEQMSMTKATSADIYHVIRLKIVKENWIISKREDTSGVLFGYLCNESEKDEDIVTEIIEESLMITTLETLDKIPEVIITIWEKYKAEYMFEYKAYIVEHTFFNIFNQEKLLRNIYLPIKKVD